VIGGGGQSSNSGNGSVHSVPGYENAQQDVVYAIVTWVENGTAPSEIIATKYVNDTDLDAGVLRQRLVCSYSAQAGYNGTGDVNSTESWSCEALY
jgi:feruloyl esterase